MTIHPLLPAHLTGTAHALPFVEAATRRRLLWLLRTPYARCIAVRAGDAVVAVAGALVLPPLGHVLVVAAADPAAWHHALHAIRTALLDNGCTTVEATAAADAVAPWHTNDFADLQELLCLAGGVAKAAQSDAVLPLEPRHHFGLLHLDRQVNAPGRLPLLLEHDYLAQVLERAGAVRGVLFPLLGEGLIMAADASAGLELQRWLLPVQAHLVLPAANTVAVEHLQELGYHVRRRAQRLVWGPPPVLRPELVFAWPWC